jgi:hypothetical protein
MMARRTFFSSEKGEGWQDNRYKLDKYGFVKGAVSQDILFPVFHQTISPNPK